EVQMSNRLRMTGINSGMDTQSIVEQLVTAKSTKKEKYKKEQTKIEWKQDTWKSLNSKLYSLYSEQFGTLKLQSAFKSKTANIVDSSIAKVSADNAAVNGTQTLAVKQLSKTAYMTGAKLDSSVTSSTIIGNYLGEDTRNEVFTDGTTNDEGEEVYVPIHYVVKDSDGNNTGSVVTISYDMTMEDIAEQFSSAGFNANYDSNTHRFFISSKKEGEAGNFTLADVNGNDVLNGTDSPTGDEDTYNRSYTVLDKLGITASKAGSGFIQGQNAIIELNGAEFESSTNSFEINGLTINATKESDYTVTGTDDEGNEIREYVTTNISTDTDVDGVYDMIKNFIKQYNEIITEIDKLYNADSAKDYEPLTAEEKESMSDEEVEKWETKIKDALLRRDEDLGTIISTLKDGMSAAYKTSKGNTYSLASFGINTLSYFEAADNEKGVYHIDGDSDDDKTKGETDLLKSMITNNLDDTMDFFNSLAKGIYDKMGKLMTRSDARSFKSLYDDKALQEEYDNMTDKIEEEEEYLSDYEDKWYDKFAAMEAAMEKVNSKANALSGLFGTG
ncbi:MAG: flagellar filament capping protein FliD, partial [Lachnospiraceae bacterium]|nr:flagellar filament capping protein FliD [Lachnospiraceae bacterium]